MATERLESAHIKQLLLYAPDEEEVRQYELYREDPSKLSEPDQFVLQVELLHRVAPSWSLGVSSGRAVNKCMNALFYCYLIEVAM